MAKTYPDYALKSGWNALLPARPPHDSLRERLAADVVIIGAGYTGLACARRWHELDPNARIVIIDASEIGEGNPGRNSGFLLEIALAEDADPSNTARMEACNQLTRQAMQSIVHDLEASGQSIDLQRVGTYRTAAGSSGLRSLRNYQAFLETAGLPYRTLDRRQLQEELGTGFYQAGLYSPDCYLAQPAALIRALAKCLPEAITVYENTPAVGIESSAQGWRISTPHGNIDCQQLVLANNSFARNLGVARSRLAAVFTYAGITDPLPQQLLASLGSNQNWGVLPTHRLGSTLRRTADGRLLVRSLHDYEQEGDANKIERLLRDRLTRRFPQLQDVGFSHIWGGAVGFTYNGGMVWGEIEPGLFASCGCNGGGTVKGTLLGSLLAEQANGNDVSSDSALFGSASWMPPEPFRWTGFQMSSVWQSWRGRHEL
ncbi:MAG: FAD-binding oxidoreductase [Gammaproteobacteria bacterium]|nr:FAD-binding oxidoreductase [Gammaproteobacteria bacterium]